MADICWMESHSAAVTLPPPALYPGQSPGQLCPLQLRAPEWRAEPAQPRLPPGPCQLLHWFNELHRPLCTVWFPSPGMSWLMAWMSSNYRPLILIVQIEKSFAFPSHGFSQEFPVGISNWSLWFMSKIRFCIRLLCFVLQHKLFMWILNTLI